MIEGDVIANSGHDVTTGFIVVIALVVVGCAALLWYGLKHWPALAREEEQDAHDEMSDPGHDA